MAESKGLTIHQVRGKGLLQEKDVGFRKRFWREDLALPLELVSHGCKGSYGGFENSGPTPGYTGVKMAKRGLAAVGGCAV